MIHIKRPAHVGTAIAAFTVVPLTLLLGCVPSAAVAASKAGGTLTVLEGPQTGPTPDGLDPATNLEALSNVSYMNAIYGELFQVGAKNTFIPDLATGYKLAKTGKTLTIHLRPGVVFSDGTPLNAAAVLDNFKRDLAGSSPAKPSWPKVASITAPNKTTVVVKFTAADGAAVNQFQDANVNWIASPRAIKKLGEKRFTVDPVGAGPFQVVSNTTSSKLVLTRNTHYWQKGHPLLSGLVFKDVSDDQTALEDLRAGSGQAYEDLTSPSLVPAFKSAGLTVTTSPGTSPTAFFFNTSVPPFNDIRAREAVYYAIDQSALNQHIFDNTCPVVDSFTGPGGLFYDSKVPGYRSYNPTLAKQLVSQVGDISFTMFWDSGTAYNESENIALQTMLNNVGMHVTLLDVNNTSGQVAQLLGHKWQAWAGNMGAWDPGAATGPSFTLASTSPFSGVQDPKLDALLASASATVNQSARAKDYAALASYVNKQAYSPFMCAPSNWDVTVKGVSGPGLTSYTNGTITGSMVLWQDVTVKK